MRGQGNTLQHIATLCNTLQHSLWGQDTATQSHLTCAYQSNQCVAVCCSVLQCVAVCCNVLQCVAVCCSVLHCVAVCCSVLQCVAVCCSLIWHAHTKTTTCLCKIHASVDFGSFFARESQSIWLFCGKWPIKIRHPMGLRHPVNPCVLWLRI